MTTIINNIIKNKVIILKLTGIMILLFSQLLVKAQQPPPRPIVVYANPGQGLNFGAFFRPVSGGTITVNPDGSRMVTGDVVEASLGYIYTPALFEIDANPGTLISILNGPDATLTGSNGGSMTLHIGSATSGTPFVTTVTPPALSSLSVGGTLTVGPAVSNPSGTYSGTFYVTFIQE